MSELIEQAKFQIDRYGHTSKGTSLALVNTIIKLESALALKNDKRKKSRDPLPRAYSGKPVKVRETTEKKNELSLDDLREKTDEG